MQGKDLIVGPVVIPVVTVTTVGVVAYRSAGTGQGIQAKVGTFIFTKSGFRIIAK